MNTTNLANRLVLPPRHHVPGRTQVDNPVATQALLQATQVVQPQPTPVHLKVMNIQAPVQVSHQVRQAATHQDLIKIIQALRQATPKDNQAKDQITQVKVHPVLKVVTILVKLDLVHIQELDKVHRTIPDKTELLQVYPGQVLDKVVEETLALKMILGPMKEETTQPFPVNQTETTRFSLKFLKLRSDVTPNNTQAIMLM